MATNDIPITVPTKKPPNFPSVMVMINTGDDTPAPTLKANRATTTTTFD